MNILLNISFSFFFLNDMRVWKYKLFWTIPFTLLVHNHTQVQICEKQNLFLSPQVTIFSSSVLSVEYSARSSSVYTVGQQRCKAVCEVNSNLAAIVLALACVCMCVCTGFLPSLAVTLERVQKYDWPSVCLSQSTLIRNTTQVRPSYINTNTRSQTALDKATKNFWLTARQTFTNAFNASKVKVRCSFRGNV